MSAQERYDTGLPIFKKLFGKSSEDIKNTVYEMLNMSNDSDIEDVIKNGTVVKTLRNDEPDGLQIQSYSSITINAFGIYFKPERGAGSLILPFTKFISLP